MINRLAECQGVYPWVMFFKQKTAYELRISDWSSDVCSSDLLCCCQKMQGAIAPGIGEPVDLAAIRGVGFHDVSARQQGIERRGDVAAEQVGNGCLLARSRQTVAHHQYA